MLLIVVVDEDAAEGIGSSQFLPVAGALQLCACMGDGGF